MADETKFLTADQVAARYGRPISWIYTCKELKACAVKIGKYLHFRESDLLALEEKRRFSKRGFDLEARRNVIRQKKESEIKNKRPFKLKMDIL